MIWTFGVFELDDRAYVLRRAGEVVPLRRKVFDVLRYLVTHSGVLVTKEELLAKLWPNETIIEAVIPQNIAVLRQALGDSRGAGKIIQTVHGKGYRFVALVRTREPSGTLPPSAAGALGPRLAFVGRDRVLAELCAQLEDVGLGQGQVAIVQGEAGMGKTRLAYELGQLARERALRVVSVHCQDMAGALPYRPWLDVLRQLVEAQALRASDESGDVLRLLREPCVETGEHAHTDSRAVLEARFRLFDAVTALLARAARARPLVLAFDDLHWADEASLQLFAFVARELAALPIMLVGTTRPLTRTAPAATAAQLADLWTASHVRRVLLLGLTAPATAELLALGLGRELAPELLRDIVELTQGNPFFVLELMRLLNEAGCAQDAERLQRELPRRIRDVILLRVRRLGADAERVLELAAVIGCSFSLPVLESLTDLARPRLLDALTAACEARLLRDLTTFSHALIQESLYDAVPVVPRAQLHQRIGLALEAVLGVDVEAHLGELARHFQRAALSGDVSRAVAYSKRAAEQAARHLAFEQAVTHYRAALEALVLQLPVDEELRYELKLGLGAALFRAGEDGTAAFEDAAAVARKLGRPELSARVVLALAGWPRLRRRGRTDNPALYPLLNEALAAPELGASGGQPGLRARLLCVLALNAGETTPLREQIALSRQALELARQTADPDVLYDALVARLRLMGGPAETQLRLELAQELLALAMSSGHKERIFYAQELCVQPWIALGQLEQADRAVQRCAALASELDLPRFRLQVLRFRLQRALGDGRFADVQTLTRQAVEARGPAPASPNYLVSLYVWQSFERALRGDRAWVERHIAALLPKIAQSRLLRAHLAALCAVFGRTDEARRHYAPLLEAQVLDDDVDDDWFMTLIWTADAVVACRDRAAAGVLYARLLPYADLNVTHVEWLVYAGACTRWLGSLAGLMGRFEPAVAHFEAAIAVNERLGARPALALCCFEYARVLEADAARSASRRDKIAALLERALQLALELDLQLLQREIAKLRAVAALPAPRLE